jgi:hypothetical protein
LVAYFGAEIATAFCVSTVTVCAIVCVVPCTALAVIAVCSISNLSLRPSVACVGVLPLGRVSVLLVRCTVLARRIAAVGLALRKSCAGSQKCDGDQSFHGCSGLLMGELYGSILTRFLQNGNFCAKGLKLG